jgi:hypothetical protein
MGERLWGLPPLLIGLYLLLMSRERYEREAERDARKLANIFPWMTERMVKVEVRNQLLLRRVVPPIFVALGALVLLGVIDVGAG